MEVVVASLHQMAKTVVAPVNVAASGAGLSILPLSCDLRFASVSCRSRPLSQNLVSFSGDYGGTYFLTHLLGSAKRAALPSRRCSDASGALALGMVTKVVPPMPKWKRPRMSSRCRCRRGRR